MGLELLDNLKVGDEVDFDIWAVHPDYSDMADEWQKCRDCYIGERAVKAAKLDDNSLPGTRYLPSLTEQTTAEYNAYRDRAQWYGATSRTVDAYLGMIFRKPVSFRARHDDNEDKELDKFIEKYLDSMAVDGKNMNEFSHEVTEEIIVTNRVGILIDAPESGDLPPTLAEIEAKGIFPRLSLYKTESIINWHIVQEKGKDIPVLFVLYEPEEMFETDTLRTTLIDSFRVLYLENWETPGLRRYKQIRFRVLSDRHGRKEKLEVSSVAYPSVLGKPLDHIPFYILTDQGLDYKRIRPPMISPLSTVNIGHYRNSADLEHECHMVALKTLVFPGWDRKTYGNPKVGGAMAVPKDCVVQLLEPSSDSSIRDEMVLKEARLAVLGAERISQKQRYLPSASVAEITASAEASVIQNFLTSLNLAMNTVVTAAIAWAKPTWPEWEDGELNVQCIINTDLADNALTGADLVNFIKAYQQGGISLDTLYYNLERREIYPAGWSKEKEIESLHKTRDLILDAAMEKIVNGETENPYFPQTETDDKSSSGDKQTSSEGRGDDQSVQAIGTKARVRRS